MLRRRFAILQPIAPDLIPTEVVPPAAGNGLVERAAATRVSRGDPGSTAPVRDGCDQSRFGAVDQADQRQDLTDPGEQAPHIHSDIVRPCFHDLFLLLSALLREVRSQRRTRALKPVTSPLTSGLKRAQTGPRATTPPDSVRGQVVNGYEHVTRRRMLLPG